MYVCTSEILAQHCRRFTVDVPIFERGKKSSGIHESRSRIPEGMSCSGSIEAEKDFFCFEVRFSQQLSISALQYYVKEYYVK
jgi:hypothetical protein